MPSKERWSVPSVLARVNVIAPVSRNGRSQARKSEAWATRTEPLEVGLFPEPALDPIGNPDRARQQVAEAVAAGATCLNLRLIHSSLAHCVEQLEAMTQLV